MKLFFLFLLPYAAIAQEVSPTPKVIGVLTQIEGAIPASGAIVLALAFVVELLIRAFPTKQPKSLVLLVGAAFKLVGSIFTKLSNLLDQVLQNTKP